MEEGYRWLGSGDPIMARFMSDEDMAKMQGTPAAAKQPRFMSDEDMAKAQQPSSDNPATSPVTSATTGLLQGGSLNFAPSIGGAGKTFMDVATGNVPLGEAQKEYRKNRDELSGEFSQAQQAHPAINFSAGLIGGGAALKLAGPAATTQKGMMTAGGLSALGGSSADLTIPEQIPQAAEDTAAGVGLGYLTHGAFEGASSYLPKKSNSLATNAIGATGKEASQFKPDTGAEMLKTRPELGGGRIVGFGSSPKEIAERAQTVLDASEQAKTNALQNDLKGVNVDRNSIIGKIQSQITELDKVDGNDGLISELENKINNIRKRINTHGAESPIDMAEAGKKVHAGKANYQNSDMDAADKVVARAYRESVEEAAEKANTDVAANFVKQKQLQGLLIPVQQAAARRAGVLAQSPPGGLLDVATAAVTPGGPVGKLATAAARRAIAPRMSSMGANAAMLGGNVASSDWARQAAMLSNQAALNRGLLNK